MTRASSCFFALLVTGCGAAAKPAESPRAQQPSLAAEADTSMASPPAPAQADTLQFSGWQDQFAQTLADTDRLDCPNACRALGSLVRSASHICGLVGESTSTCQDVQKKSTDAQTRVHDRCGACP